MIGAVTFTFMAIAVFAQQATHINDNGIQEGPRTILTKVWTATSYNNSDKICTRTMCNEPGATIFLTPMIAWKNKEDCFNLKIGRALSVAKRLRSK